MEAGAPPMKINFSDFPVDRFRIDPYLSASSICATMLLHRFIPQSRQGLEIEVPMVWRRVIGSANEGKCPLAAKRSDSADCPAHPRSRIRSLTA